MEIKQILNHEERKNKEIKKRYKNKSYSWQNDKSFNIETMNPFIKVISRYPKTILYRRMVI